MNVPSVLFVDDEPHLLDGLRDALRRERKSFESAFAVGGEAGLEALAARAFDVVVADMRMPGLDGAAFLRLVEERRPNAVRVVLSGQADAESLSRALPVAHQFLSKPCEGEALKIAVRRALALRPRLDLPAFVEATAAMDRARSRVGAFWRLANAAAFEDASALDLRPLVSAAPTVAARVVGAKPDDGVDAVVARFGDAMSRVGPDPRYGLVQAFCMLATIDDLPRRSSAALAAARERAFAAAEVARRRTSCRRAAEEGASAALFRDVGAVLLSAAFPERFEAALAEAEASGMGFAAAAAARFGASHAEIGSALLGRFGVAFSIVDEVATTPTFADDDLFCDGALDDADAAAPEESPSTLVLFDDEPGESFKRALSARADRRRKERPVATGDRADDGDRHDS